MHFAIAVDILPFLIRPSFSAADCLAATLREYQLEGLRWLVGMWDRGMDAILAGGRRKGATSSWRLGGG
jgi:SNF2 family DNA or RNA helicase